MFTHLSAKDRTVVAVAVAVFLAIAAYVGSRQVVRRPDPVVIQEVQAPPKETTPSSSEKVVVHVVGAVPHAGVYSLHSGDRVNDAVAAAGGLSPDADPEKINLAAKLLDGSQVFVPRRSGPAGPDSPYAGGTPGVYSSEPAPSHSGGKGKQPSVPVDLNTATEEQLESIPGIGPSTAERILDYRKEHGSFKSVDELTAVGGIGAKKLDRMRKWLHI